jgi:hypothetical protein
MAGGSSLNILYVETFDAVGVSRSRSKLRISILPFLGIIPGMRAYPLGNIELLVTFSDYSNFRTETLIFEVVDFEGCTTLSSGVFATPNSWRSPTTPTLS